MVPKSCHCFNHTLQIILIFLSKRLLLTTPNFSQRWRGWWLVRQWKRQKWQHYPIYCDCCSGNSWSWCEYCGCYSHEDEEEQEEWSVINNTIDRTKCAHTSYSKVAMWVYTRQNLSCMSSSSRRFQLRNLALILLLLLWLMSQLILSRLLHI